jgi:hypothetical protein
MFRGRNHIGAKLRVAVEWQESVRLFVGPGFSQLRFPQPHGISRNFAGQDLTPVVPDDENADLPCLEDLAHRHRDCLLRHLGDPYIIVTLDEACRQQQVGEAWFAQCRTAEPQR